MFEAKLRDIELRYNELQKAVSDPDALKDKKKYRELMQECAGLAGIVDAYSVYKKVLKNMEEAREMEKSPDCEMRELALQELRDLERKREEITENLKLLLLPRDPLEEKDIIMEIRAGTGGEEAALFVSDLFRMYFKYAEMKNWKIEVIDSHNTEIGGFKEIIFSVKGKSVYENMRYESGGHRVQRVPETETGGRIHTSAVTVAVLPEAEETDIEIKQEDLRIDVFRSGGPGGQSVNTTDSAVRITHVPSGLVVICQDEKSQHKNKAKALRVLRSRLFEIEENKKQAERAAVRKNQIGSGDRSERIRTYNFPQNRLTDHRINLTLYKLDRIMEGDLNEVIETLKLSAKEEFLKT